MKTKKELKTYQITWTANAFETIEAYSQEEALELAQDGPRPSLMDFVVAESEPEVEIHPDHS